MRLRLVILALTLSSAWAFLTPVLTARRNIERVFVNGKDASGPTPESEGSEEGDPTSEDGEGMIKLTKPFIDHSNQLREKLLAEMEEKSAANDARLLELLEMPLEEQSRLLGLGALEDLELD